MYICMQTFITQLSRVCLLILSFVGKASFLSTILFPPILYFIPVKFSISKGVNSVRLYLNLSWSFRHFYISNCILSPMHILIQKLFYACLFTCVMSMHVYLSRIYFIIFVCFLEYHSPVCFCTCDEVHIFCEQEYFACFYCACQSLPICLGHFFQS